MKINNNNAILTFITKTSLTALTICKWLDILIKKINKIMKINYLFNARGRTTTFLKKRSLNHWVFADDVLINSYNKKFYYNINDILMTYMYSVIKRVNNYVSHTNHNGIITM
jgi:hypothetical protein